jgi:hypothetical protein
MIFNLEDNMMKSLKTIALASLLFFGTGTVNATHEEAVSDKSIVCSYYGEKSKKTGREKTVWVKPYKKKDGTQVDGYYRSKPKKKPKS